MPVVQLACSHLLHRSQSDPPWLAPFRTHFLAAPSLSMTDDERSVPEKFAKSRTMAHRTVLCAHTLRLAADGVANNETAQRVSVNPNSVRMWRRRFEEEGLDGVGKMAPGRGRKPSLPEGTVAQLVSLTMNELSDDGATVEHAINGRASGNQPRHGGAHLEGPRSQALEDPHLQGFERSELRREARRRHGPLHEPAAASGGLQFRREDPGTGAGPRATVAAPEEGRGATMTHD